MATVFRKCFPETVNKYQITGRICTEMTECSYFSYKEWQLKEVVKSEGP